MDWFNDLFIEEAKAALSRPAGNSSGGGLTKLPDGYPYKEQSVIEWDGNTDGKVVLNLAGIPYYKVAEYSEVNLVNETATVSGEEIVLERQYELFPGSICYFAGMMEVPLVIQIPTDTSVSGIGDIEQGTYFLCIGKEMVDGSIIPSEMVVTKVTGAETIHPIAPEFLPEGYPYKDGVSIEWDGNTEGREHTAAMGMELYWVSPEILTDEEIKNGKVFSNSGGVEEIAKYWDQFVSGGYVTEDATLTSSVAVVRKANAEVAGVVFSTPGVYFVRMDLGGMVEFISKFSNETVHLIAPEFLPFYTVTVDPATNKADYTGEQIAAMAEHGWVTMKLVYNGQDQGIRFIYAGCTPNRDAVFTNTVYREGYGMITQYRSVSWSDTTITSASKYTAAVVADAAGDTPTAAEFNALLAELRNAGILATS